MKLSKLQKECTKLLQTFSVGSWTKCDPADCFVLENVLAQLFLLAELHLHFNTFCVLCTVKANEQNRQRTKTYNKKTGEFGNQFVLLIVLCCLILQGRYIRRNFCPQLFHAACRALKFVFFQGVSLFAENSALLESPETH